MNIIDFIYEEEMKHAERRSMTEIQRNDYIKNQLKSLLKIALEQKENFEPYLQKFYGQEE